MRVAGLGLRAGAGVGLADEARPEAVFVESDWDGALLQWLRGVIGPGCGLMVNAATAGAEGLLIGGDGAPGGSSWRVVVAEVGRPWGDARLAAGAARGAKAGHAMRVTGFGLRAGAGRLTRGGPCRRCPRQGADKAPVGHFGVGLPTGGLRRAAEVRGAAHRLARHAGRRAVAAGPGRGGATWREAGVADGVGYRATADNGMTVTGVRFRAGAREASLAAAGARGGIGGWPPLVRGRNTR